MSAIITHITRADMVQRPWNNATTVVHKAPFTREPVRAYAAAMIDELLRPEVDAHSHDAMGVAGRPFNTPVEMAAEVELKT